MKRSFIVLLHIGFWTCYSVLIFIVLGLYGKSIHNTANHEARVLNALASIFLFACVPSIISFYAFYFIIFPGYLQQRKIVLAVIFGLLVSIGADLFTLSLPGDIESMPEGYPVVLLDTDPWELGKNYPEQVSILGEPKVTLPELTQAVLKAPAVQRHLLTT